MPRNVYWEHYLHFVWRTKNSAPFITPAREDTIYNLLVLRARKSPGITVHAIGGMPDHVHLAVSLPPTIEPAWWIGDIKGATSHAFNHDPNSQGKLVWQTGYGVVSFGKRDLPWVCAYIRDQKQHHAAQSITDRLERIDMIDDEVRDERPHHDD